MNLQELRAELNVLELSIVWDIDRKRASVGNPRFANPLLWFDAYEEDYAGSVVVKSINVSLFSEKQIKQALQLVDTFLGTPVEKRGL